VLWRVFEVKHSQYIVCKIVSAKSTIVFLLDRADVMRKLGMDVDCAADIAEARSWVESRVV